MNSGEHREGAWPPFPNICGMRGSLELEVSIFREARGDMGTGGRNLGPQCSDSAEGWKCHLIQETQVTSGIGTWHCCDGSGHASILDHCHGGLQGQKQSRLPCRPCLLALIGPGEKAHTSDLKCSHFTYMAMLMGATARVGSGG